MTTILLALTLAQVNGELTPRRAMELLEETHRLMRQAEEQLNEANPAKAERHEQGAADRLAELIRKARGSGGRSAQESNRRQDPASPRNDRPAGSHEPSKFSGPAGSWGHLPPNVRRVLLEAAREEVPPEFREMWMRYRETLEESVR